MAINNIDTNTTGTFQQSDILDPKANLDSIIMQNTGNGQDLNGIFADWPMHDYDSSININTGSGDIDTGSGDNEVIINSPQNGSLNDGPLNVNTGSGDDYVVYGQSAEMLGPHSKASVAADKSSIIEGDIPVNLFEKEINTNMGSGNDRIRVYAGGNHTVDLGTGDDNAYVKFQDGDSGNNATINGGSGNDKVTLGGSRSDYAVSREEGYNVYTDQDGNTTKVADDVEDVRFLMDDIGSHEYPGNIVWDEDPGDRVSWG
jgi:hypothetical protein